MIATITWVLLSSLGLVARDQGDFETARLYLEKSLEIYIQLDDPRGQGVSISNLGLVARSQGDYEAARLYHEEALKIHKQLGNLLKQATDLSHLGLVAMIQEDYGGCTPLSCRGSENLHSV